MIPKECQADIETVLERNRTGINKKINDIRYLMTIYLTYVDTPKRLTIEEKVNEQMRCGKCRAYVWGFFNDGKYKRVLK